MLIDCQRWRMHSLTGRLLERHLMSDPDVESALSSWNRSTFFLPAVSHFDYFGALQAAYMRFRQKVH